MKNETIISKRTFNKLVKDISDNYVKLFQGELNNADNPQHYWEEYKSKIGKRINDIINDEKYKQETIDPFMALTLSENQKGFDYYDTIKNFFANKSTPHFNTCIKECAEYVALLFASEDIDILIREGFENILNEAEEYSINTITIYHELGNHWKEFDRDFVSHEVRYTLMATLKKAIPKLVTTDYINLYEQLSFISSNINNFPIPRFFIDRVSRKNKNFCFIGLFEEMQYVIPRNDNNFYLLFTLQFYFTDVFYVDKFLAYQLKENFNNDIDDFETFLENLLIKYDNFLKEKHRKIITRFISISKPKEDHTVAEIKGRDFTTARQVLAIHYLMKKIGINSSNTDMTTIARFIQFLNGKEVGVKNIKDTTIYQKVKKPFSSSDKALEKDLQFIRDYFEKLSITSIVDEINNEIKNKDKNIG